MALIRNGKHWLVVVLEEDHVVKWRIHIGALRIGVLRRMRAALRPIDGLAGEKFSWMKTVGNLENSERHLLGDILVASAQVAYLGAFNGEYRQELLAQWAQQLDKLKLLHSPQLSVYAQAGPLRAKPAAFHPSVLLK
jgi:hypothetical protein